VADFGLSRSIQFDSVLDAKAFDGQNPVWLAPEILGHQETYNERVDVYSFGIILWEMLSRADYFGDVSFMSDIEIMVVGGKRPAIPDKVDEDIFKIEEDYKTLLKECWQNDPQARPSFQNIVERVSTMKENIEKYHKTHPDYMPQSIMHLEKKLQEREQAREEKKAEEILATESGPFEDTEAKRDSVPHIQVTESPPALKKSLTSRDGPSGQPLKPDMFTKIVGRAIRNSAAPHVGNPIDIMEEMKKSYKKPPVKRVKSRETGANRPKSMQVGPIGTVNLEMKTLLDEPPKLKKAGSRERKVRKSSSKILLGDSKGIKKKDSKEYNNKEKE